MDLFYLFVIKLEKTLKWCAYSKIADKVADKVADKLNRTQEKILQLLRENPDATTEEMASILQMSPAGIRKNLSALRDGGYIERVGSRKAGRWKVLR